jgi:hypothetical protein
MIHIVVLANTRRARLWIVAMAGKQQYLRAIPGFLDLLEA